MNERKRRARGEGGVSWDEKRKRWIAEKTVGYDGRGKRIVRKASGTSQSAALRELAKRVKSYQAGLAVHSEHVRIKQAVEDWLPHGQGDVDGATRERNRIMCETHIIPKLGGRKLQELRPDEVDGWLRDLSDDLATSTLRRLRAILVLVVKRAMRRGLVDRNVVELCDVPRGRAGRRSKSLTLEQAQAVLTNMQKDPLHCYIVVSLLTGARTEELRALRWEHVHLDAEPPHVEVWRSVRRTGDTKTRQSRRPLALPGLAAHRLREHRVRQAEERLRADSWFDDAIVFATAKGTPMDAANVRRDLRIEDIAGLVGHQGTRVTEHMYRHELRPIIQTGATAMDALFDWPPEGAGEDG